jgi:membrane associated rhomboid family serine protease/Zn-finger nucleic acid-binding protein
MYVCPQCLIKLKPAKSGNFHYWGCPNCLGRLYGFAILRRLISDRGASEIWRASEVSSAQGRGCPACSHKMSLVASVHEKMSCEVDVCRRCYTLWLDQGETPDLDHIEDTRKKVNLNEDQMKIYAKTLIEMDQSKHTDMGIVSQDGPDEGIKWLPAILGLPIEFESKSLHHKPILTWLIILICFGVYIKMFRSHSYQDFVNTLGFLPSDPFKNYGLTIITSFFTHGGLLHLLSNMYFLFIFADDIEDETTPIGFLILLLGSHICGIAIHMLSTSNPEIPLVGASGGIFGVLAYYSVRFATAKIGFLFYPSFLLHRLSTRFRPVWFRFQAKWIFIVKLSFELIFAYMFWRKTGSQIAHGAHIGGAIFGYFAAKYYSTEVREHKEIIKHFGPTERF